MNWGRWNENTIKIWPYSRYKFLGPAKSDRIFYLRFWRIEIRIMQPFRNR